MLGHDRPGLIDPPAFAEPTASDHGSKLAAWRRRSMSDQRWAIWGDDGRFTPSFEPARGRLRVGFGSPCLGLGRGGGHPRLDRPSLATGRTLAGAVLADIELQAETRARVDHARRFTLERLEIDRFGREWTDLLIHPKPSRRGEGSCRSIHRVA